MLGAVLFGLLTAVAVGMPTGPATPDGLLPGPAPLGLAFLGATDATPPAAVTGIGLEVLAALEAAHAAGIAVDSWPPTSSQAAMQRTGRTRLPPARREYRIDS